jgi:hypothetical protein
MIGDHLIPVWEYGSMGVWEYGITKVFNFKNINDV